MSREDKHAGQIYAPELGKRSSPVRGILKDVKKLPAHATEEAERLLGEAWRLVNLGVPRAKEWHAELLDRDAVTKSNKGDLAEAERLSLAGLAVLSDEPQSHNHTRARSLRNYSQIMIAGGDYESALGIAEHALAEHDIDIENHKHDTNFYAKGLRHMNITQTYYDRALILGGSDKTGAAENRLLEFLETYDDGTLSLEVERVVDFVEEHIDPSIRDRFMESNKRSFTLNPVKLGGAAIRSAFRLGNSGVNLAKRFVPKL